MSLFEALPWEVEPASRSWIGLDGLDGLSYAANMS
jgi:hypothetical protein